MSDLDALRALSNDPDEDVVICLPWGQQMVPSVKVSCMACGRALGMSKSIRKELPAAPAACPTCAQAANPGATPEVTRGARMQVAAYTGIDPGEKPGITLGDFIKRMGPL